MYIMLHCDNMTQVTFIICKFRFWLNSWNGGYVVVISSCCLVQPPTHTLTQIEREIDRDKPVLEHWWRRCCTQTVAIRWRRWPHCTVGTMWPSAWAADRNRRNRLKTSRTIMSSIDHRCEEACSLLHKARLVDGDAAATNNASFSRRCCCGSEVI